MQCSLERISKMAKCYRPNKNSTFWRNFHEGHCFNYLLLPNKLKHSSLKQYIYYFSQFCGSGIRMRHSRNGSCLLHVMSAGDEISKMVFSLMYMAAQLGRFEQLGAGWDDATGVIYLSPDSCCWRGSSTFLCAASPLSHPHLVFPNVMSPGAGYSAGVAAGPQERGSRSCQISYWQHFLNWHSIRVFPLKTFTHLYKILFFSVLLNLGLEIPLTVTINILCNLALTKKELEFHFGTPPRKPSETVRL